MGQNTLKKVGGHPKKEMQIEIFTQFSSKLNTWFPDERTLTLAQSAIKFLPIRKYNQTKKCKVLPLSINFWMDH